MPATVECDVLPSVDVDHSEIEHLEPGQQGELTDEFATCFSGKPELCGVCRIWLLFVFLVCGVVVLSMTACFEYEIVKLITDVWHRCCVIFRGARYCEYCCEQPCVCFKRLRLLRNLCYSVVILIDPFIPEILDIGP